MKNVLRRQSNILNTLASLQWSGLNYSIIAGGAVRDLHFDILPRDIDIFVWHPYYADISAIHTDDGIHKLKKPMGFRHDSTSDDINWAHILGQILNLSPPTTSRYTADFVKQKPFYGVRRQQIHSVYAVLRNRIPYDIILTKIPPVDYVRTCFDVGLCKVYTDGCRVHYSGDFLADEKSKTLTIVGKMTYDEFTYAMNHHVPRLKEKFPQHSVRMASHNQELYDRYTNNQ